MRSQLRPLPSPAHCDGGRHCDWDYDRHCDDEDDDIEVCDDEEDDIDNCDDDDDEDDGDISTWQCVVDVGIPAILQTITTTEAVSTTVKPKLWRGKT